MKHASVTFENQNYGAKVSGLPSRYAENEKIKNIIISCFVCVSHYMRGETPKGQRTPEGVSISVRREPLARVPGPYSGSQSAGESGTVFIQLYIKAPIRSWPPYGRIGYSIPDRGASAAVQMGQDDSPRAVHLLNTCQVNNRDSFGLNTHYE